MEMAATILSVDAGYQDDNNNSMKKIILLQIICLAVVLGYSQVTPFTGGNGSGFTESATPSVSCALYAGGNADGTAVNNTSPLNCSPYSGGDGDGYDANNAACEVSLFTKETNPQTGSKSMWLFPNPASGVVTLRMQVNEPLNTQLILFRPDGQIAMSYPLRLIKGVNQFSLKLVNLTNGIYFVYTGKQFAQQRLIILNQ